MTTSSENKSITNGTQATDALLTGIGEVAFKTTYNDWVTSHSLNSENLSAWYIPTLPQLSAFMGMLFQIEGETIDDVFKAIPEFADNKMFEGETKKDVFYASCSISNNKEGNGNIGALLAKTTKVANSTFIKVAESKDQKALCRPMITIFK